MHRSRAGPVPNIGRRFGRRLTEDDNDTGTMKTNDWTAKVFTHRNNSLVIMALSLVCIFQGTTLVKLRTEATESKKAGFDDGWKQAVLDCKRGKILRGPLILSGGTISNCTFHIVHIMDEAMLSFAYGSNYTKAEAVEIYNDNGGAMWIGKVEPATTTE